MNKFRITAGRIRYFCQILGEYRPAVILNLFRKPGESTEKVLVKSVKTASTCQYIDVHQYSMIHVCGCQCFGQPPVLEYSSTEKFLHGALQVLIR